MSGNRQAAGVQAPPTLSVEQVPIEELRPDPANPRRISEEELDALERSLRQWGFVQPILARRDDAIVIGGHQRLVAARRLGLARVPVIWLDLSAEQARVLGLALNKISGTWDEQLLARLLAELQSTPELDLSLSGFDEDEIKELLRSLETREKRERPEAFDLDEALEKHAGQRGPSQANSGSSATIASSVAMRPTRRRLLACLTVPHRPCSPPTRPTA